MAFHDHKDLQITAVAVAPAPPGSGTTMTVGGALTSVAPFYCLVYPNGIADPDLPTDAELIEVTNKGGGTDWTIVRQRGGTAARDILIGDLVAHAVTAEDFRALEPVSALSAASILDVGISGQRRAGRVLTAADFTTLLGLTAPVALYNLADLTDASGNGRTLSNRGAVAFTAKGITGAANEAALFTGADKALYITDTGAADPFRIKYGSFGCWFRTEKRAVAQILMSKASAGAAGWEIYVGATNLLNAAICTTGGGYNVLVTASGDVCDGRWHFAVATYDGALLKIYQDGRLVSAVSAAVTGPIVDSAGPFDIGCAYADAGVAATLPAYGPVDEAFVTADVLSAEQVRLLYALKVAHGASYTPLGATVAVRRRRRGGALASGDFPSQPLHLYNFTGGALTDAGSLGTALTNNGAAVAAPGAAGDQGDAFNFIAASTQFLSCTDTGLPAGTDSRSYGAWFKSVSWGSIVFWGTVATNDARILISGQFLRSGSGPNVIDSAAVVSDGKWHFGVVVEDNGAVDGVKRKLYLDGACVAGSTTLTSLTLAGAGAFRIGAFGGGTSYFEGQIDGAFVCGYALTAQEVAKLYAVGAYSLGLSPKNPGDHVERVDATSVYLVADTLDSQNQLDVEVHP